MSLEPTQEPISGPEGPVASFTPEATQLDAFPAPELTALGTHRLVIEFCDRCRWLHRATWVQTELFTTFPPPATPNDEAGLSGITLLPCNKTETAGRWRVWLYSGRDQPILLWDRKTEGGFGELKELKQRVRDHVRPSTSLGHSDKPVQH